ncbi:MAG TPA: hypothetical protein VMT66_00905 [Steroidobacteraceae bacterium]|nr:hypothetical protein [Steroidobacteraceae bacterium]
MVVRAASPVALLLVVAGLAACATTKRVNLSNATQNLEYDANALLKDSGETVPPADPPDGYSPEYTRDAQELARSAHALRLAVDAGANAREVRAVFDRVARSYHAVRDEVAHSESLQVQYDFGPLTDSYRAVEHELGIPASRREYVPTA